MEPIFDIDDLMPYNSNFSLSDYLNSEHNTCEITDDNNNNNKQRSNSKHCNFNDVSNNFLNKTDNLTPRLEERNIFSDTDNEVFRDSISQHSNQFLKDDCSRPKYSKSCNIRDDGNSYRKNNNSCRKIQDSYSENDEFSSSYNFSRSFYSETSEGYFSTPDDSSFAKMDCLYRQVCMMDGVGGADSPSTGSDTIIKQEESLNDLSSIVTRNPSCASPTTTTTLLYSPSANGIISKYDCSSDSIVEDALSSPRLKRCKEINSSPASPERQFCSSTTSTDALMSSSCNVKEEDGPKRICLVCGDQASGFHYGVASCEACKAFFKRTIQGNIEYNCPATNNCEINKRRRKACQACRFNKCQNVGMLKEGVRLDRVRGGRQKYRRTSDSPFSIGQNFHFKKTPLDDIKILNELQNCEPNMGCIRNLDATDYDSEFFNLAILADLHDNELVSTIGWAKSIPGFTTLGLNDQMRLLQSTWGEILILSLAFRSIPSTNRSLRYAYDFVLNEKIAKECNALELFTQVMSVIERLEQCSIVREEYLLLKALVLTNSDVRVQDTQGLFRFRQDVLQAIHDAVPSLRTRDPTSHIQSLLLCLPCLRAADTCLRRFWLSVRAEGCIELKKLFLEMLDTLIR